MMRQKKGNGKLIFIFYLIVLILLLSGILGLYNYFKTVSFLNVKKIELKGNQNLETMFLNNLVKDFVDKNILTIDKDDVEQRFSQIIRIKNIKVRKFFPTTLKIYINERIGSYLVKSAEGEIFPIDSEMVILDRGFYKEAVSPIISTNISSKKFIDGEVLQDHFVTKVINIHNKIKELDAMFLNSISEYYNSKNGIILVESTLGYKLILPEENFESQFQKFLFLKNNTAINAGVFFDLRFDGQIIELTEEPK